MTLTSAPRPIGGLCSRALRFGPEHIYLEELLVRHALRLERSDLPREEAASGVMMIPVPRSGIFERVRGLDEAERTPDVEEIRITARLRDYVAAWPEGSSYLGFIFARGSTPEEVEAALRSALAARAPALIEVSVGPMSNVWPVIGPAGGVYPIMLDPPNVT